MAPPGQIKQPPSPQKWRLNSPKNLPPSDNSAREGLQVKPHDPRLEMPNRTLLPKSDQTGARLAGLQPQRAGLGNTSEWNEGCAASAQKRGGFTRIEQLHVNISRRTWTRQGHTGACRELLPKCAAFSSSRLQRQLPPRMHIDCRMSGAKFLRTRPVTSGPPRECTLGWFRREQLFRS